ncbi:carbohydrate esterase family 5 protein [Apiospora kogelbergensis]|uniref:carbohydrate esterase family 5 protein n=1 Tax=Apiospora kogelbergensis TaxID=1337665 RepID=UPI0031324377
MKFTRSLMTAALAAAVTASPIATPNSIVIDMDEQELSRIQETDAELRATVGTTANEFTSGGCRDVVLVYARGTGQDGNMGERPGPALANALKSALGDARVAAQGVNYSASLLGNLASGGAPANEATQMATLVGQVASKCPSSSIVIAGYSQGAALVHRAAEKLTAAARARVAAAVTFGDTQKKQDGGRVPTIDAAKTRIFCNDGDRICEGTLIITSAHSDYTPSVAPAVSFIVSKV